VTSEGGHSPIRRVGVVGRDSHPDLTSVFERLARFADVHDVELFVEERLAERVGRSGTSLDRAALDLLVALGGDGTLLRAGRIAAGRDVPVVGINLGRLGFLTASPDSEMESRLQTILDGHYAIDHRTVLEAVVVHDGDEDSPARLAWNDFVIHKTGVARVTVLDVLVEYGGEWQEFGSFSGDGLIVATPTGSTAYSLSAGGPIIVPAVDCMVLTPICPHTLAARPLVVPASQQVAIRALEQTDALVLTVDGQEAERISAGDQVRMRISDATVPLVRFHDQNFYSTIQHKLNWAARPEAKA
jgi:NAD+ kinase